MLVIVSIVLLITLIFTTVRMASVASASNDQLVLSLAGQQQALIDLRQSEPISPYLFGVNVFPEEGTNSAEKGGVSTGFMSYAPAIADSMRNAGIKMLRFPGGSWGENQPQQNHILSLDQLYAFSTLLSQVGAEGMIQARLSSPSDGTGNLASLQQRANLAGTWVDFMSNPKSTLRTGKFAHVQIHPIAFWTVGNEPDRLNDPSTGKPYTVAGYVRDFIQFSIAMHQNNPSIRVFGPEISQFYGVGVGPTDADGQLWMEGFLKGVAQYEQAHSDLKYHLLDGVSFHFYPFNDARHVPSLLMSSAQGWNYLLPQLRQEVQRDLGRAVPLAVTEINSNPNNLSPSRGQAALWWADTLGTLMNQETAYAAYFSAEGVDQPYPLFTSDATHHQTAMFRVMQMFSHLQHNLVPLQVQQNPISAYATQDDTRQTVSILFINKSVGNEVAHINAANSFLGMNPWPNLDISLAGYSLVLVTLHRNGGAEAFSFPVPTTTDALINPIKETLCGNKVDPLDYSTPC